MQGTILESGSTKAEAKGEPAVKFKDITDRLESKARDVMERRYMSGECPGMDNAWAADLHGAAAKLQRGEHSALSRAELQEIEAVDDGSKEFEALHREIVSLRDSASTMSRYL